MYYPQVSLHSYKISLSSVFWGISLYMIYSNISFTNTLPQTLTLAPAGWWVSLGIFLGNKVWKIIYKCKYIYICGKSILYYVQKIFFEKKKTYTTGLRQYKLAKLEGLDSICNKDLRNQRFGGENISKKPVQLLLLPRPHSPKR